MNFLSKSLLCSTLFLLSLNAHAFKISVKSTELLLLTSASSNKASVYKIKKADSNALPEWDGEGTAPLSTEDATDLAKDKHKEKFTKAELRSISLKSKRTNCFKDLKCPNKVWYYKAKVKGDKRKTYVILMDGSFVKPEIVKK